MEYITYILSLADLLPVWINAITALVVAANGITILTPTKTDNKIVDAILKVLNIVSLNIGKNKNADDK